jgi:hypothetical protein
MCSRHYYKVVLLYLQEIRKVTYNYLYLKSDRLSGLVIRVTGYRYRGPGFDSRRYQLL